MVTIVSLAKDDRAARIALATMSEPDDSVTGRMVAAVGAVETVRLASSTTPLPKAVDLVEGELWRRKIESRLDTDTVQRALADTDRLGLAVIVPGDRDWPTSLNDLGDRTPTVLWARGATSFLSSPARERVTITGSRAATGYGTQIASDLAANLADDERIIVAGGAFGIEGAAHRGTLAQGGHTVAVLAGGVDRAYPSAHRELLERIGDVGLLMSELPPGAAPSRQRFLARGRLLAALSGVTVVPEASARSGAMRTARQAYALGRGVGAVPGPVTSVTSAGPHELVKCGIASMVTATSDVTVLLDGGSVRQSVLGLGSSYQRSTPPQDPGRSL